MGEKARKEKSRAELLEDAKKEAKDESDRLRKKLLTVQGDLTKLKHRSKLDAEEAQQKLKSLQEKIDASDERGTARATEINELKKRLKRQEVEMATESRIGAKMSEKIIERLQKKVKDQDKKIKDIGKYSDAEAEKLELETKVAALQKTLRAKEVEDEEAGAEMKLSIDRLQKEVARLTDEKNKYSTLCSDLKAEMAILKREEPVASKKEPKRRRDQVRKLKSKLKDAEDTIKNLRKKLVGLTGEEKSDTDALVERLKKQTVKHDKAIKELREKHEAKTKDLTSKYEDRIAEIRATMERKIESTADDDKEKIDRRLEMLREQHDAYTRTLKAEHKAHIDDISSKFEKQLKERDDAIRHLDPSLLSSLSKYEKPSAEGDDLESAHRRALAELQRQIVTLEDDLSKEHSKSAADAARMRHLENSIDNLKRLFEASERRLKNNIDLLEEQSEAMKLEHEEDLVAMQEKMQATEKEQAVKYDVGTHMLKEQAEEINRLKSELKLEEEKIRAGPDAVDERVEELQMQLDDMTRTYEDKLGAMELSYEDKLRKAELGIEGSGPELLDIKDRLAKERRSHDDWKRQAEEENDNYKQELREKNRVIKDLNDKIEELRSSKDSTIADMNA